MFLTASEDGTVRTWTLTQHKVITKCINTHKDFIRLKNATGRKCPATCVNYSPDGKYICAGASDGSLHVYATGKNYVNATFVNRGVHTAAVTSMCFSYNNQLVLTRSSECLWQLCFISPELCSGRHAEAVGLAPVQDADPLA